MDWRCGGWPEFGIFWSPPRLWVQEQRKEPRFLTSIVCYPEDLVALGGLPEAQAEALPAPPPSLGVEGKMLQTEQAPHPFFPR